VGLDDFGFDNSIQEVTEAWGPIMADYDYGQSRLLQPYYISSGYRLYFFRVSPYSSQPIITKFSKVYINFLVTIREYLIVISNLSKNFFKKIFFLQRLLVFTDLHFLVSFCILWII